MSLRILKRLFSQKLVSKNLTSVGMALVYQLAELRGMVRVGGTYEALGLRNETLITNAINESEAFLAKSYEIEQVIDQSMRNYKAFFRYETKIERLINLLLFIYNRFNFLLHLQMVICSHSPINR